MKFKVGTRPLTQKLGPESKILVFTPCFPSEPRIYPEAMDSILGLKWPDRIEFLQRDGEWYEFPAWVEWLLEDPDSIRRKLAIAEQYERMRQHVLDGDYDAVLTVEADNIVPEDAVHRLVQCDADIAYGTYVLRSGLARWNVHTVVTPDEGLSISEDPEYEGKLHGVVDVQGAGLGCTLIKREVLERISFVAGKSGCDWHLAYAARMEGFTQRADLDLMCGHRTNIPSPRILWPLAESQFKMSINFLDDSWYTRDEDGNMQVIVDGFYSTLAPIGGSYELLG